MSILLPNFSQFYYGYKIQSEPYNGYIDIDEGSGEIAIAIPVGSYTLNEFAAAIQGALVSQGTLDYSVNVNRITRRITISADANFDILADTGSHTGNGIYSLIGFSTSSDLTGQSTYTGSLYSGSCYAPQYLLQSYVSPDDWQERNQASINISASATNVEVINFGLAKFIQFEIKYITNRQMDGIVIKNNPSGLSSARNFLRFISEKNFFEFMPDANDANTFYKVLLESTPDYSDGTGYKLKELLPEGLPGIFETGLLKLRVID